MSSLWIKNPLASFDGTQADSAAGGIVVTGGRITEVLPAGGQPSVTVNEVLDASQLVLLPGLINTHHHFYQTLTRAYEDALNKPLFGWLTSLYPVWANLTDDLVEVSSKLALAELLLSGCTTAVDHHYVFSNSVQQPIDRQISAAQTLGIRVVLTRGSMSLGESQGGLPPDKVVQSEADILADSERLISAYHQADDYAMHQIALAPCSPFSVTGELMRDTAIMAQHNNVLMHTHLAETHDETEFCIAQFGARPLDYLESLGWLNDKAWFAHGIHFNDDEVRRLGQAQCGIAHCPSSNMVLASGICPVHSLEQAGANVGLGVDGSASNDCSNLSQEVRQSLLIQRLSQVHEDASLPLTSHIDALRWATKGGANLLKRPKLGRIEVGAAADIALFSLDELRFSGSQNPLAALVLGGAHRAQHVMVNGHWRVFAGQLQNLDEQSLRNQHHQAAQDLWQQAL